MQNELNKHKTSDSIKWWLTFIAFIVVGIILTGIIAGWFNTSKQPEKEQQESSVAVDINGNFMDSETIYPMSKAMTFSSQALYAAKATSNGSVSVQIEAYVWPENATNSKVDYSLAWGSAPNHGTEKVTDYVTVTQATDGNKVATVSCHKAFDSDIIILTVTTRDGGYTDTCRITFAGIASSLDIQSDLSLAHTTERGSYYDLGTGKTYNFDLALDNVFGHVGNYELEVAISGIGEVYFGTSYSDSMSGFVYFQEVEKKSIEEYMSEFINVSIDDKTLVIETDSTYIENYYSYSESDEYFTGTYTYDRYVYFDEWGFTGGSNGVNYQAIAEENQQLIKSCYYLITVTDTISGLSDTIKVWVAPSVSGVNLSEDNLGF